MSVHINSPAPDVVGNSAPKEVPLDNGVANETAARAEVPLTPDAPTTTLQIRLVDGTRLIATFNHSHTVGDIHRYIITYPFDIPKYFLFFQVGIYLHISVIKHTNV